MMLFIPLGSIAYAGPPEGGVCKRKEQAILRQMEIAKQHGNQGRIRGLERALANVRTWCSDGGQLDKSKEKIEEKQEKVKEREKELAEAKAEGKGRDKIAKRERKLEEAKSELRQATSEREALLKQMNDEE